MNAPSRSMPPSPAPEKATAVTWIVLALFVGILAWGMAENLPLRWVLGATAVLMAVLTVIDRLRLKRIREKRKDESICTFARALPARDHDTWVVRAVYEEVSRHVQAPIRPSDDIARFWGIHGEDLEDAAIRVAHRAGRSMTDTDKNPLYGNVRTAADMIAFLEHQPKLPARTDGPRG